MEGEQTWPTDEEIADADRAVMESRKNRGGMFDSDDGEDEEIDNGGDCETRRKKKNKIRVPKGTSAYQAAWILDEDEDEDEASEDDDNDEEGDDDMDGMEDEEAEDDSDSGDDEYEDIDAEEKIDDFDVDFNPADDDRQ